MRNAYGPTETTVCATISDVLSPGNVVIGKPIANTQVYVLDDNMSPTAVGVAGELFIGGVGLARGYWNRPTFTADRFVPDPFSIKEGQRLYRTGDRVRWTSSGNLEFLGRIDEQLKIRGCRIEPGEVQALLEEHSAVQAAVVVGYENAKLDVRLVAYVVPHPMSAGIGAACSTPSSEGMCNFSRTAKGQVATVDTPTLLRAYLRERLPEHMVPSFILLLEELPRTPNGKLDRRKLPAPQIRYQESDYATPLTATEELLSVIWQKVLA